MEIMGAAHRVHAHLLIELRPAESGAAGHHLAGQAVILVPVFPLDIKAASVQEKALPGKGKGAEAEAVGLAVDQRSAVEDARFHRIQDGILHVPAAGMIRKSRESELLRAPGRDPRLCRFQKQALPVGGKSLAFDAESSFLHVVVPDLHVDGDAPLFTSEMLRMDEHAAPEDVRLIAFQEPDVAVNAAALIPPALMAGRGIRIDGDHVILAEEDEGADIQLEGGVAREIPAGKTPVDVNLRVRRHPFEIEGDPPSLIGGVQGKMPAVPGVVVPEMPLRPARVALCGSLGDDKVVGDLHVLPGKAFGIRPGRGAPYPAFGLRFQIPDDIGGFGIQRRIVGMVFPVLCE